MVARGGKLMTPTSASWWVRPPLAVDGIEPVHDGSGRVAVGRAGLCLLPVA